MQDFLRVLSDRQDQLIDLALQHIQLTIMAVVIAVVIGVPVGILITRNKRLANIVIGFANFMQAIPSLALLGFLIPFVGIGTVPAIIMVVMYSMLPILKNTYSGLENIDPALIEVAKGIGLTKRQALRLVKLPLAVPIIMTGIRISAVTAVGLMTIAAFIGAGGLGFLVFSGVEAVDTNLILIGAIPAALLALLVDFVIGKIEGAVSPSGMPNAKGVIKRGSKLSKKARRNILIGATAAVVLLGGVMGVQSIMRGNKIVIGSKAFTEQLIVGNILAELIEQRTDLSVDRQMGLGGTQVVWEAMRGGNLDIYVEYSGTAYSSILGHSLEGEKDPTEVYNTVVQDLQARYGIRAMAPLGFNNTYVMIVRPDWAAERGLETISDLAAVSQNYNFAPTIEFMEREDGWIGMERVYNIAFNNITPMRGALLYTALVNGEVEVISGFATDGLIARHGLTYLEDDQGHFLPYYAFIMAREEILEQHPELEPLLMELENRFSEEIMQELNAKVDEDGMDPRVVAREFLESEGLI